MAGRNASWIDQTCQGCGAKFKARRCYVSRNAGKYCSRACWYANRVPWNKGKQYYKTITKPCEFCGKPQTRKPKNFTNNRVFCNASCMQAYRLERSVQPKFHIHSKNRHRYAKIFGSACIICGFDRLIEYAHMVPIRLGGKSNKKNLLPMCPNHHRLFDRGLLEESEIDIVKAYIETLGLSQEEYSKISWGWVREYFSARRKPPEEQGRSWHHRIRKEKP